jgi:DNA helicase-2/ATP-dependent DNA helicase PcrA
MSKINAVYGPPGTGKTTYLLNTLGELVKSGMEPDEIGYFAFTRTAANEALKRLGLRSSKTVRTLHSLAFSLCGASTDQMVDFEKLKAFSEIIGYEFSGRSLMDPGPRTEGDDYLDAQNFATARLLPITEVPSHLPRPMLHHFAEAYRDWKESCGFLDFNDILERARDLRPDLGLKTIFIDEAQDLTPLQWSFADVLIEGTLVCYLAGDDDQAIFSWAGASPHGMRERMTSFNVLNQSHRIPKTVHILAQNIVGQIKDRVPKAYSPRQEIGIVQELNSLRYLPSPTEDSVMILYRNHKTRTEIEQWLISKGLPYTIVGQAKNSLFESPYAVAVRTFQKMAGGQEANKSTLGVMKKYLHRAYKDSSLDAAFFKKDWRYVFDIPDWIMNYLERVDLSQKPKIRVGTIHSAKGAEAEHVILFNERTSPIYNENHDDECRVWYVGVTRAMQKLTIIQGDNPFPFYARSG